MREEITQKIDGSPPNQVNLEEMAIKDAEIQEILNLILLSKPKIQSLFLNNNEITDVGAIILQGSLAQLVDLTFLDLQFNFIDKEGALALMRVKSKNPALQIALHGNKIVDTGVMREIEEEAKEAKE